MLTYLDPWPSCRILKQDWGSLCACSSSHTAAFSNLKPGSDTHPTGSQQILLLVSCNWLHFMKPQHQTESRHSRRGANTSNDYYINNKGLIIRDHLHTACLKSTLCIHPLNRENVELINNWHQCCSPLMKRGMSYLSCVRHNIWEDTHMGYRTVKFDTIIKY